MGNERLLESKTLVASMEDRAVQYESLKKQFVSLKNAFQKIVDLDGFKGQGARAIKGFYQGQIEVVDSWISICNVRIAFFNGISGSTEDVDLSGDTLVQVPFLKEELYTGHTQSKEMVDSQHKSLKSIFDRINDLVSLQPFSKEDFEEKIDQANKKRKDTMEQVANLDEGLVEEYASSEYLENIMVSLFSALLDATSQGSTISPINFDAQAYHNSDVYQMREDAQAQTDAYLEFKEQQEEQRRIQKEMEELENRPWYEKAWDTVSTFTGEVTGYYDMKRATTGVDPVTGEELSEADRVKAATFAAAGFIPFVGWAGRAAKGGNAIYKTAKGVKAVDHSLDAYKNAKAFTTLQKTEYGIYGLASANGFSEYITGKDMFGNELSEEKRNSSLTEALFVLGVGGAGAYVDRLQAGNAVYKKSTKIAQEEKNISFVNSMSDQDSERYHRFWEYVENNISVEDRIKLSDWNHKPSGELYAKYKPTFDNPKYYNQVNGKINWPPNDGFEGTPVRHTLEKGALIDRYGGPKGNYLSPQGEGYEQRALALHSDYAEYHKYKVRKPFNVRMGEISPWFDREGGGIQFHSSMQIKDLEGNMVEATVENLLKNKYIKEI
ncbi:T7SS effector LXG polymorphic toxin [Virgibacillus halodenitrificans]|uniref:T7SS effector LXG polymorphic toxin n=1 Tax=Virgibacillus halodenitrificans TaxID=1482 RepID=UPI0024BF6A50|nr:T7SS effector LXG polymorphic toxin [Virgibacillus halodenitrificans]WHX24864.1 T7SS effector LXG polymorphic toxin [Virgibacillus halodenitrificans]